jgi:hypothetical protein
MYKNTIKGTVSITLFHLNTIHYAALNFFSKLGTTFVFVKNSKVTANIKNMLEARPKADK